MPSPGPPSGTAGRGRGLDGHHIRSDLMPAEDAASKEILDGSYRGAIQDGRLRH